MGYGLTFAKNQFATRAALIDELAARDENFRDLCDDFATANELRLSYEIACGPERDERHAEYVDLVDSLRIEIEAALNNAMVVLFHRPRR